MANGALRLPLPVALLAMLVGCGGGGGGGDLDGWADTGDVYKLPEMPWGNPDVPLVGDVPPVGQDVPGVNDPGTPPPSGPVDPNCTDGQYQEALPKLQMDISGAKAAYSAQKALDFIYEVLGLRYPTGAFIIQGGMDHPNRGQNCVDLFLGNKSNAAAVIQQLSTLVHECGHFYDLGSGGFYNSAYILTEKVSFSCKDGHVDQFGGKTFARSRIKGDQFGYQWPPCGGLQGKCDFYADVYLDGNPDNGSFEGGDQGFDSVLEETLQYVNSLATGYAFHDQMSPGYSITERDGILTFLWYLERYLHMARNQYPAAWNLLSGDPCWRDVILSVWGRAWIYLSATENLPKLGINADKILPLVLDPVLLGEIDRLRQASGCP